MKLILPATAIAAALMLSACGGETAETNTSNGTTSEANLLEGAQQTIDNVAEGANSANVSDMLENQSEAVGNAAENAEASEANAAH